MMRLFSRFDLFIFNVQKFIFLISILLVRVTNYKFRYLKTFLGKIFNFFLNFFNSIKFNRQKFFYSMNLYIFFFIFLINFMSLNSYIFSFTSQLRVVLIFSLFFWVSRVSFILFNNFKYFISHFIPNGSPIYLVLFLFLIELVRNVIRFITLTVRLTANILAGHLLVILLRKLVIKVSLVIPIFIILNFVEVFVSLIQSYIFCTIICLYYSEIE